MNAIKSSVALMSVWLLAGKPASAPMIGVL
jgi:hypothetical protein